MRYMALDIGDARIGIAISDPAGRVASPLKVLPAAEVLGHAAPFRMLVEDWMPDALVCGLPFTLAGEQGLQAASLKERAQRIAKACDLPLYFSDERLSSSEAKRFLREGGYDERAMRGKVDMIAASIFLQSWLDSNPASKGAAPAQGHDASEQR